jgi:hypothetical protein
VWLALSAPRFSPSYRNELRSSNAGERTPGSCKKLLRGADLASYFSLGYPLPGIGPVLEPRSGKEKAGSIRGGTGSGGQSSQQQPSYEKPISNQQLFCRIFSCRPVFIFFSTEANSGLLSRF